MTNLVTINQMGTLQGKKLGSEAAAESESISADSLSFAGLVSMQDQQPNPPKQHYQYQVVSKEEPDFEFSTAKAELNNSAANPFKTTPADMLISNGKIKPHANANANAFQPNRPFITNNPPISLRSLLAIEFEHISGKMASGQTVKARDHKNKGRTWFGQKMLRSFISPCRKCQAIQPGSVKGQTVPAGERYKIDTLT